MRLRKKEILVNGGLLLGSILLTVILIEIGFAVLASPIYERQRYLHYFDVFQWNEDRILFDSILGFITRPNLDIPYENVEFSTRVRTNSHGFRDDEASLEDPEVLFFGDSFGFGWGVNGDETAEAVLEKETDLKVLNMSVSGYGTIQEFLLLQRWCEVQDATGCEVVIQYFWNDQLENRNPPGGMYPAMVIQNGRVRITEADEESLMDCVRSNGQTWVTYLCQRSAILDLVLSRYWNPRKDWANRMAQTYGEFQKESRHGHQRDLDEYKIFEYTVRLMLELSAERNMNLHFVLIPSYGYYLGDRAEAPYRREEEILDRLEVSYLNPYEAFGPDNYFDLDGHFNPSGHRKLGIILADFLSSSPDTDLATSQTAAD